jgi:hypothetical protein
VRLLRPYRHGWTKFLAERLRQLITLHPTFGYRRLWALLRFGAGLKINPKADYRVLRLKGWCVHQRTVTPRARVQGLRSRVQRSDERWAIDMTHMPCGTDGWGHLTAVIDCPDREVTGFELAYAAAPRKPNARSRKLAWHVLAPFVGRVRRPWCVATTVRSSGRGVSVRPVVIIGCARSSSRRISWNKMGQLSRT